MKCLPNATWKGISTQASRLHLGYSPGGYSPGGYLLGKAFTLCAALCVFAILANAQDNYYLKSDIWNKSSFDYNKDNDFEDRGGNHLEAILEGAISFEKSFEFVAGLKGDYFAFAGQENWQNKLDLRPHNLYLDYQKTNFGFRLGNQVVVWGKTDEISPINTINPEDLRDGFVRRQTERKLPIPMVNLEVFGEKLTAQFLYIPFFVGSEIRKTDSNWAYFGKVDEQYPDLLVEKEEPANSLSEGEFGLRVANTFENLDMAISYLHRRNRLPTPDSFLVPDGFPGAPRSSSLADLANFAASSDQTVMLSYAETEQVGLEIETAIKDVVIRGDLAFLTSQPFISAETLTRQKNDVISYVLGADYHTPSEFFLNIQFSQQVVLDYSPEILIFPEASAAFSGEISQLLAEGQLKPDFYYYVDLVDDSFYLNPAVVLKYWETCEFELGADIIGGPKDSVVGLYRNNDQAYIIARFYL